MIRKTTWVVLMIFAVLLAAVLLWQRLQDEKAGEATPDASEAAAEDQYLFEFEGEVAALRIEHVGDKTIELVRDETGQWTLTGAPGMKLDSAAMDTAVSSLATLPLVDTLKSPPELDALGLNPPSYRILVTLKDGEQLVASVGKVTPTGSGYYVLSSDRRVYIANEFSLQSVLDLVENPPYQPTPNPLPADLTPGAEQATPTVSSAPGL
jgi:hypothetical protein